MHLTIKRRYGLDVVARHGPPDDNRVVARVETPRCGNSVAGFAQRAPDGPSA